MDKADNSGARLIDMHHHVVLPEYEQALARSGAGDPSRPLRKNDPAEVLLERMGETGIDAAILNPLSVAGVHHGNDANARYLTESVNEAMARYVSQAPDRLGFLATLPLPDLDGALEQMGHALDTLHADGVIFMSNQNGFYIGDPAFEPLYAEMNRRAVNAFIHPGMPPYVANLKLRLWPAFIEYAFDTTRVAANLIYHEFMGRYPNIRWILAHAGGTFPYLSMRMRLMEEMEVGRKPPFPFVGAGCPFIERVPEGVTPYLGRFYFETAFSGGQGPMAALAHMVGPDHILYGSDLPFVARPFVMEQIDNLRGMPEFAGERFNDMARNNARALFPRFSGH
ncbi:MAG: amidohydrolase [Betaproteobacteria bacterium]|nr:amidohydrolase [Betaproteobacteria bacterium]